MQFLKLNKTTLSIISSIKLPITILFSQISSTLSKTILINNDLKFQLSSRFNFDSPLNLLHALLYKKLSQRVSYLNRALLRFIHRPCLLQREA